MRQVRYYLEDDTVDVTEPKQLNSGLPQVPCSLEHQCTRQVSMHTSARLLCLHSLPHERPLERCALFELGWLAARTCRAR